MPREFSRAQRVADQVQRDLSELIHRELRDPRVGLVTITAVDVSRDLSHAKVYVSSLGDEAGSEQWIEALQHAAGFLRTQLRQTLKIRNVPRLQFVYDRSLARGVRLSHLIDEAVASSEQEAVRERDEA